MAKLITRGQRTAHFTSDEFAALKQRVSGETYEMARVIAEAMPADYPEIDYLADGGEIVYSFAVTVIETDVQSLIDALLDVLIDDLADQLQQPFEMPKAQPVLP